MNRISYLTRDRRSAFTLVELLVVMAIIAILMGLLLAGVMAVIGSGDDAKNRNDILQLSEAMQKFKSKYGFYPPNQLKLCSNYASYSNAPGNTLDNQSKQCLSRMWPNLVTGAGTVTWNWGNRTPAPTPFAPKIDYLDSDQTLVFFLGGIPNGTDLPPQGFSTNPQDPTAAGGDRISFMTFPGGRIKNLPHPPPPPSSPPFDIDGRYPSFIDAYATQPFIYFSTFAFGRDDGYDPASGATFGVIPYKTGTTSPKYHNPKSFQIVSAGRDGLFGPGDVWPNPPIAPAALDDMTNFHGSKMGSP